MHQLNKKCPDYIFYNGLNKKASGADTGSVGLGYNSQPNLAGFFHILGTKSITQLGLGLVG